MRTIFQCFTRKYYPRFNAHSYNYLYSNCAVCLFRGPLSLVSRSCNTSNFEERWILFVRFLISTDGHSDNNHHDLKLYFPVLDCVTLGYTKVSIRDFLKITVPFGWSVCAILYILNFARVALF